MHLKSLTLKGFKSFADRTQMGFDPGLNVIVGPNGSGKSNVSDAILWVLGEQSAKQLRGQAMEDVIFSGSSARKPVGLAEVTLVLDNSDRTLPVEFDEVGVTRRMYRSGESEYLINGAPARLMDIQDILHDSGLGRETSSIISQGKLDAVLQAKPEERRTLVEEAAGISKHKRRKERSARKLKNMDENIVRARDVSNEIARQLRPLERQVNKARRANEINERLEYLQAVLAVDDLRQLQRDWSEQEVRSREAEAAAELARYRADEQAAELEKLQLMLEKKGLFVGDLGEQRRRMQDVLGRFDSDMRLLEEKGRNMVERISEIRMQLSSSEAGLAEARKEHAQVTEELQRTRAQAEELERRAAELGPAASAAQERRQLLASKQARLAADQRAAQRDADNETLAHAKLSDQIANHEAEDRMYASRLAGIAESLEQYTAALAERESRASELEGASSRLTAELAEADLAIERGGARVVELRKAEDAAREALGGAKASLAALQAVDEQTEAANPLASLVSSRAPQGSVEGRLSDLIEVPGEWEAMVERLLGDDLGALVARNAAAASDLAEMAEKNVSAGGRVTMVSLCEFSSEADSGAPGVRLLDRVKVARGAEGLVQALLGNVRVVNDAREAARAHETDPNHLYVTPAGAAAFPDGRVVVGERASGGRGSLERKRRIRAIGDGMPALEQAYAAAGEALAQAEKDLAQQREKRGSLSGDLARVSGELTSATSEIGRLQGQQNQAQAEREQVSKARQAAADKAQRARDEVERHRVAAVEATARAKALSEQLASVADERNEASKQEEAAADRLSQTRLELATASERRNNLAIREEELLRRARDLDGRRERLREGARALEVVRLRVQPLYARYEAIQEVALSWAKRLRDRASLEEASNESLKKTIADARERVAEANKVLESAQAQVSDAKVASGKLEVQVRAALNAITDTGRVLDEALELPEPLDRDADEREVAKLKRQLAEIGPVNQVAMEEYEALKTRADYINSQLDDLERARTALNKITAALDRKMRRAFMTTYRKVDTNFREIFAMLFPGGQGHLVMTDPDHPAETGIEVVAQPRGKRLMKMTLLSGGERSLTALALLFAVYRARTTPFYVFDEVEAALDDSNLDRLLGAIELLKEHTQLLVISHQRRTMEQADVLYGVSMQADGVSRVISQRLDRATGKVVDA